MATIDTSLVDRALHAIAATSNAVKTLLRDTLEQIEINPAQFELLDNVPPVLTKFGNLAGIRKAKITSKKHDFRLVFAHWRFDDEKEHVDILLAFRRKDGYEIDWEWVESHLNESCDPLDEC